MDLQRIFLHHHTRPDGSEKRVFADHFARMVQKHDKKIERAGG